jgi:hypothetical protein
VRGAGVRFVHCEQAVTKMDCCDSCSSLNSCKRVLAAEQGKSGEAKAGSRG